jgi:hypothetical protein
MQEIEGPVPDHLKAWWEPSLWALHSPEWWRRHWDRTGLVAVEQADAMPDGWKLWLEWLRLVAPDNVVELETVEADQGRYLGYVRVVGRRRVDAKLDEPIVSIPTEYKETPFLRGEKS